MCLFASLVLLVGVAPLLYGGGEPPTLKISGETNYPAHSLVRLSAVGVSDKAGLLWRVYPASVHRATNPRGVLEFTGPPGQYRVELLSITTDAGGVIQIGEAFADIRIGEPPPPTPPPTPPSKADPVNALGRIQFGQYGCTATIIGPRRADGRWDVLTAAHCIPQLNMVGSMTLKDGRRLAVRCVNKHSGPDVAWLVTEQAIETLPYAELAPANPNVGTQVWHMGYGVDKPGNKENGRVTGGENSQGMLAFHLSVSSGDSGGGILTNPANQVVSTVCCTQGRGVPATMYGGATRVIHQTRPPAHLGDIEHWTPIEMPLVEPPTVEEEPEPCPITD